ncbi:hypothetical protein [Saccharopolyspora pogona]|uniref:hypothetical protein n=1 Tax=Saccharopolyspora pogona TaxID=333966 RepID=UPI001684113A|nr:hypothetical protein [Saccharopolyspora pogona]
MVVAATGLRGHESWRRTASAREELEQLLARDGHFFKTAAAELHDVLAPHTELPRPAGPMPARRSARASGPAVGAGSGGRPQWESHGGGLR